MTSTTEQPAVARPIAEVKPGDRITVWGRSGTVAMIDDLSGFDHPLRQVSIDLEDGGHQSLTLPAAEMVPVLPPLPKPPPPKRVTIRWRVTELHSGSFDTTEIVDRLPERVSLEGFDPLTDEWNSEDFCADEENGDTYDSTEEREVIEIVAA